MFDVYSFDRMLYLSVSTDHKTQHNILSALTRKFNLDPDLDLMAVAERCPFNYTGADFYALCSDAMLKAMSRTASEVDKRISELIHAILLQDGRQVDRSSSLLQRYWNQLQNRGRSQSL